MPRSICLWLSVLVLLPCTFPIAMAGDGPRLWSQEWWADRSTDPPGSRQVEKKGKLWPPYPRPTGRGQTFVHRYHHTHYWPYPYSCADKEYVSTVLDQQAGNGWATATTLYDYHFQPDSAELNTAGRNQVMWVVQSAPLQYRTLYVAQSGAADIDQMRLASITAAATEISGGNPPGVVLRTDTPTGRPAQEIDIIRRREITTMPAPRLQMTVAPQSGGGGAGGMAGGAGGPAGGANPTAQPQR